MNTSDNSLNQNSQINNFLNWKNHPLAAILLVAIVAYTSITAPKVGEVFLTLILFAVSLYFALASVPIINRRFKTKISIYHVASLIIFGAVTVALSTPAQALFLTGLQTQITSLPFITDGIGAQAVVTIINVIKVVAALLVIAAIVAGVIQSRTAQDMTPIYIGAGSVVGAILSIDFIVWLIFATAA